MQAIATAQIMRQHGYIYDQPDPYKFRINEHTSQTNKHNQLVLEKSKNMVSYKNHHHSKMNKQSLPATALPDPRRWAAQIILACLEVVSGIRPAHSLVRWCNKELLEQLLKQRNLTLDVNKQTGLKLPHLKTHFVKATCPHNGVAEVSMIISINQKMKACALRLEVNNNRWKLIALEIG